MSGGLRRQPSWVGTETLWDGVTAYTPGQYVKRDYPAYVGGTTYAAHNFVSYSGYAYRSIVSGNVGHQPDISPTFWQEVPFEFFLCMIANTNKDPHDPAIYTTNSAVLGDRYWKQVYDQEAAIELIDRQTFGTVDGQYFYGLTMRQNDHRTLIRMDNDASSGVASLCRFIGGQIHSITSDELAAMPGGPQGPADHSQLIQIGRAIDCTFEHMHIRSGVGNEKVTLVQLGWKNPAKTAARIKFDTCNFSAAGNNIWGVTQFPSVPNFGHTTLKDSSFAFVNSATSVYVIEYNDKLANQFIGMPVLPVAPATVYASANFMRVLDSKTGTAWLVPLMAGTATGIQSIPRSTTASLENIASTINTVDKFTGKLVINTTTGLLVTAFSGAAGGVWQGLGGSTLHTPV